jgi:hypothetical protein
MTALVEELVPDELWAVAEPLLPPPPRPWWAAGSAPSRLATASPRSSIWSAPSPPGACCCPGAGLRLASHGVEPASLIKGCLEGPRRTRGVRATRGWNGRGGASLEAAGGGGLAWRRKRLPPTGQMARTPGAMGRGVSVAGSAAWRGRARERPAQARACFSGISRTAGSGAVGRIQQGRGRRLQRCIDRGAGRGSG